ncbi:YrzI family small protein [Neobacillus mesonae]|nr:YrzI family small protein [Neobacillus mesonae]MCM3566506.1 YrzI family small protein [Neobacillus mesonae]
MTLNILFLSITIKKRKRNLKQIQQQEMVDQLFEQHKDRQMSIRRFM